LTIKAISFDVFDTLVANNPSIWLRSFEALCLEQGLHIEPLDLWEAWHSLERRFRLDRLDRRTMTPAEPFQTYEAAWTACFRQVFDQQGLPGDPEAAATLCIRDFRVRPIFPETEEALARLGETMTLAVVSNAHRGFLYPVLDHYGIGGRFAAVVCSEDVGAYKPHPGPFELMLERLDLSPDQVLHVGDKQEEDVWGPSRLGMRTAWVNRDGVAPDPALPEPDHWITNLSDLIRVLEDGDGEAGGAPRVAGKRGDA
jgi:2-haloalkanoic acid dehalogenase type II